MNSELPEPGQPPTAANPGSNAVLRRVVIIATVLSLATADGWMASFQRQPAGQTSWRWGWATLIWIVIGGGTCLYFWRKIWPPPARPAASRRQIMLGAAVLGLPSLWWLTFPLRFLSGQTFWDVTSGLVAAALVLSFGAYLVIKLIRAFERSDTLDTGLPEAPAAGPPAAKPVPKDR